LLKIDKTVLATVVAEEEGGETLLRSSALGDQLGKKSTQDSDDENKEDSEDKEEEGEEKKSKSKFDDGDDIFDILRAEVTQMNPITKSYNVLCKTVANTMNRFKQRRNSL